MLLTSFAKWPAQVAPPLVATSRDTLYKLALLTLFTNAANHLLLLPLSIDAANQSNILEVYSHPSLNLIMRMHLPHVGPREGHLKSTGAYLMQGQEKVT